jgi:hypothetical protein
LTFFTQNISIYPEKTHLMSWRECPRMCFIQSMVTLFWGGCLDQIESDQALSSLLPNQMSWICTLRLWLASGLQYIVIVSSTLDR